MKRFLIVLALLLVGSVVSAKQCVVYYRYNFALNVASSAKKDLDNLISQGFKIISLDLEQLCMIVVYDDMKE